MGLKDIWNKFKSSPSVSYPFFQVESENVLDANENLNGKFEMDKHYFEIRIVKHFLKDRREYWNDYTPMTAVLSEFSYAGSKHTIPFVVGPKLLSKLEQVNDNHEVVYNNTRVVGPSPYRGDQVVLFTGLFRMRTKNWAVQALDFLQTVAGTFDASKLSEYLDITSPILEGLESFLGMEDMELRMGQRTEYSDASLDTPYHFRPGYWVMIRSADAVDKSQIYVKDNGLFIKNGAGDLVPYKEDDYIIYSIEKLMNRTDFSEFDFHKKLKKIKELIWRGVPNKAKDVFLSLLYDISVSEDFTQVQKNKLQVVYKDLVTKEMEKYKEQQDLDSLFGAGAAGEGTKESGNKYRTIVSTLQREGQLDLTIDDVEGSEDEGINDQIIHHLESGVYKEIDLSGLDSELLADNLYGEILKL